VVQSRAHRQIFQTMPTDAHMRAVNEVLQPADALPSQKTSAKLWQVRAYSKAAMDAQSSTASTAYVSPDRGAVFAPCTLTQLTM
jgi:hypothetical protein